MASKLLWILLLAAFCQHGSCTLRLASYFGDHMVLQRAPQQAVVWGTAGKDGDTVTATVEDSRTQDATIATATVTNGEWKLALAPQQAGGPFTVTVTSSEGTVTLTDVLFGDVWLCGGQSNMYFGLTQVMNKTVEIQQAAKFPDLRFTRVKLTTSATPQDNVTYDIPWTGPSSPKLGRFSAVCWLFGEYLNARLGFPVGLVESAWGSTPIEAWSPKEALDACSHHATGHATGHTTGHTNTNTTGHGGGHTNGTHHNGKRAARPQAQPSRLWNAMINPLLKTTIYGALWYQGEANANHASQYTCQIEQTLKQWRSKFHQESLNQTSASFPFGYVQLAGIKNTSEVGGFPGERWAQTANYGYSPNPALPDTFMAVAMDLSDFDTPAGGTIHPRFKQDVAERLVLGALNVAYGQSHIRYQGPFPTGLHALRQGHKLQIKYDNGTAQLQVKNNKGFEVCCTGAHRQYCDDNNRRDTWVAAPISDHPRPSAISLDTSGCGSKHVVGVRYEWRTSPCDFKQCALYDVVSGLPAPPYVSHHVAVPTGPEIIG